MKKLIVVIGLPGSGKSHYVHELHDIGTAGWICEDFHANAYRNSSHPADSRYLAALIEHLQKGTVCAVADIAFCDPARREEFEDEIRMRVADLEIEFHCFENSKEYCAENVERRGRETVANEKALINKFSPLYEFPHNAKILPVYQK